MIYTVTQHYSGCIVRKIEADTKEQAEDILLDVNDITLGEMGDCNWDNPIAEEI